MSIMIPNRKNLIHVWTIKTGCSYPKPIPLFEIYFQYYYRISDVHCDSNNPAIWKFNKNNRSGSDIVLLHFEERYRYRIQQNNGIILSNA